MSDENHIMLYMRPETKDKLNEISEHLGRSKSSLVTALINEEYRRYILSKERKETK